MTTDTYKHFLGWSFYCHDILPTPKMSSADSAIVLIMLSSWVGDSISAIDKVILPLLTVNL